MENNEKKVVLLTGASSGIGKSTAMKLLKVGGRSCRSHYQRTGTN